MIAAKHKSFILFYFYCIAFYFSLIYFLFCRPNRSFYFAEHGAQGCTFGHMLQGRV